MLSVLGWERTQVRRQVTVEMIVQGFLAGLIAVALIALGLKLISQIPIALPGSLPGENPVDFASGGFRRLRRPSRVAHGVGYGHARQSTASCGPRSSPPRRVKGREEPWQLPLPRLSEVGRTEPLDRLQRAWPIQARRHAAQHAQEYLAETGLSCRTRALCVASLDESRVSPAALMRAPGAGRSRVGAEMSCGGIVLARLAGRSHHRPSSCQRQSRVRQRWPMPCPS